MKRGIILLPCLLGAALICAGCDDSPTKQKILKGVEYNSPEAEAARQEAAVEYVLDTYAPSASMRSAKEVGPTMRTACVQCHGMDRVCAGIGVLDFNQWGKVLADMLMRGAAMEMSQVPDAVSMLADEPVARKTLCD